MAICVGDGLDVVDGLLVAKASPDACNGLQVRANGLWSECVNNIAGAVDQLSPQSVLLPIAISNPSGNPLTPTTFGFLNDNSSTSIHVCNTTCCTVTGSFDVTIGGLELDADPGFFGNMSIQLKFNSGAFAPVVPLSEWVANNVGGSTQRISFNGMSAPFTRALAPGECVDVQWAQVLSCAAGTGNLGSIGAGPRFTTRWMFVQTGCAC